MVRIHSSASSPFHINFIHANYLGRVSVQHRLVFKGSSTYSTIVKMFNLQVTKIFDTKLGDTDKRERVFGMGAVYHVGA